MDILDIVFDLPQQLINLTAILKDFLFSTVTINGIEYSFWLIIAGVGVVALILFSIIKS